MHRRPVVIANWKMETTLGEAVLLARRTAQAAEQVDDLDVVLLPPVIWLPSIIEALQHKPKTIHFGVQNIYPADHGAFTGEIGLAMIQSLAQFVLIGHSERRTLLGETNELIAKKIQAVLAAGLQPILCVGELTQVMLQARGRGRPTILQRDSDVIRQLRSALAGVSSRTIERLIICYEPLWAIGTGANVPGAHVQAVLEQLRAIIEAQFGATAAQRVRTIYGGSVTAETIDEYVRQPDIDGVLVGGASLDIHRFRPILEAVAGRSHQTQHIDH